MIQQGMNLAWFDRLRKRPFPFWIAWVVFLCLPVLLTLFWGDGLSDEAYLSLRFAQTLGQLESFTTQILFTGLGYTPLSPLSWMVLAMLEWAGWQVPLLAAGLSAIGWGVTAVIWQKILRTWQCPIVDWILPLLLVVSPVIVMTRGSFVSWFVALAWLAILLTVKQKWRAQTIVLLLLPLVYLSITAVVLIVVLVIWRITITRKFPWLVVVMFAVVVELALIAIVVQMNQMPWQFNFPIADWLYWGRNWLVAGEFALFFVLIVLVALIGKRQTWPIATWLIFVLLDVNGIGYAVFLSGLLFLTGVGAAVIGHWLVKKKWFAVPDNLVYLSTVLLLCLPLTWMMISTFFQGQLPPSNAVKVGMWLNDNSEDAAVVIAEPAVGYYADRTVWSWNGRSDQGNWADFIRYVEPMSVDYIITDNTLFWDGLQHLPWWQDRYKLSHSIGMLHIWQYSPPSSLLADTVPLDVVLENGVKLVGYQQSPKSVNPGEAIKLSLHFQADEPIGNGFNSVVWLPSPRDGENQALQDLITPRGVPSNWWEPGQIVTEQFVLTTTEQIPVGGYRLTVSFRTQDNFDKMPVYQNQDSNPLDRIQLGYVAVPWGGTMNESAKPFDVVLGNEIKLLAADLPSSPVLPGEEIDIQLYWEAVNPDRPQHNYTIFVHLLNEAGEMVANADGFPQGGQYPTEAWVPGDVVVDEHRLLLPQDLQAGIYQISIGAYLLETGERLPVMDEAGIEIPGASIMLMEIVVE